MLIEERSAFEERYGVKSSWLVDAFRKNGRLVESPDFVRWAHTHDLIEKYGSIAK